MRDGWAVGLSYYDSRIDVCGFVFFGCHGVTALQTPWETAIPMVGL